MPLISHGSGCKKIIRLAVALFLEFYLKSRMPGSALQHMARCGQDVDINTGRCSVILTLDNVYFYVFVNLNSCAQS